MKNNIEWFGKTAVHPLLLIKNSTENFNALNTIKENVST